MRIGNSQEILWSGGGVKNEQGKATKRTGPKSDLGADTEQDSLDAYEQYQRRAFESISWDATEGDLRLALQHLEPFPAEDGVRLRRLRAQQWALERMLQRRERGE